jgi:hypothetical protein
LSRQQRLNLKRNCGRNDTGSTGRSLTTFDRIIVAAPTPSTTGPAAQRGSKNGKAKYSLNIAGCCKRYDGGRQIETLLFNDYKRQQWPKTGGQPASFSCRFPSVFSGYCRFSSVSRTRRRGKGAKQPELEAVSPEVDPLSKSTIRLERFAKWLTAATLVSIFCTAWVAWSIHELHDFAFQQAKSVNDSIEISRYAILAANRRAEATEKIYDLAAETSRSQLRAYVSVLGISTQNAFEKNMASSLNYKNVGQTPALGLRTLTDAAIISSSGSDVKPPRTYSTSYGVDNEPTIALGGGIAASDPVNRTFREGELEEFRAGTKLYVVWGAIYYSDVFGKNHYTRFCRYFKNGELSRWILCQTGNDSN